MLPSMKAGAFAEAGKCPETIHNGCAASLCCTVKEAKLNTSNSGWIQLILGNELTLI